MRKKPYLSFKDLRAALDREGRVRLSSSDPRLAKAGWSLTLNRKTRDEELLRTLLSEATPVEASETASTDGCLNSFITAAHTVGNAVTRLFTSERAFGVLGPYIGTTEADNEPVFYSPQADGYMDNRPVCFVIGQPGSGSTNAARRIVMGSALQGAVAVSINWSDTRTSSDAQRINLRDEPDGFLNPFELGANAQEGLEIAQKTVKVLLGGVNSLTDEQRFLIDSTLNEVAKSPTASLGDLIQYFSTSDNPVAKSLAYNLIKLRDLPQGRLIFRRDSHGRRMKLTAGENVIMPMGLRLPQSGLPDVQHSHEERLGISAVYLLVLAVQQAFTALPKAQPKLLHMEETWTLTTHGAGRNLAKTLPEFGSAQNAGFLFSASRPQEAQVLHRLLGGSVMLFEGPSTPLSDKVEGTKLIFPDTDHAQNLSEARELELGSCLMIDGYGRKAIVKIEGKKPRPSAMAAEIPW